MALAEQQSVLDELRWNQYNSSLVLIDNKTSETILEW